LIWGGIETAGTIGELTDYVRKDRSRTGGYKGATKARTIKKRWRSLLMPLKTGEEGERKTTVGAKTRGWGGVILIGKTEIRRGALSEGGEASVDPRYISQIIVGVKEMREKGSHPSSKERAGDRDSDEGGGKRGST